MYFLFVAKFSGNLRVAGVWSDNDVPLATAQKLDECAERVPIGGTVSAHPGRDDKWDLDYADMRFHWRTIGSGDLFMYALPHQMDTMVWHVDTKDNVHFTPGEADMSGVTKTSLQFEALRGL